MAKKITKSMNMSSKRGCSCSMGKMILGVIIMAAGLYAIVAGFQEQTSYGQFKIYTVFLYYVVGLFLFYVGKFFKKSSYMCCEAHSMMCK